MTALKPDKKFVLHDCDLERAEMLRGMIKSVRCWLTGFRAAGGSSPPDEDGLRQLQVILDHSIAKAKK